MHVAQALTETGQTVYCALSCSFRELAIFGKPFRQPYWLSQSIDDAELTVAKLADDHVKAVGSQINRRDNFWYNITTRLIFRSLCGSRDYLIFRSDGAWRPVPMQ